MIHWRIKKQIKVIEGAFPPQTPYDDCKEIGDIVDLIKKGNINDGTTNTKAYHDCDYHDC